MEAKCDQNHSLIDTGAQEPYDVEMCLAGKRRLLVDYSSLLRSFYKMFHYDVIQALPDYLQLLFYSVRESVLAFGCVAPGIGVSRSLSFHIDRS